MQVWSQSLCPGHWSWSSKDLCLWWGSGQVWFNVTDQRKYYPKYLIVRFATNDFTLDPDKIKDNRIHVTNFDVNKKSSKFTANEFDPTEPVGHKWTLTALWKYLASEVRPLMWAIAIFCEPCLEQVPRSLGRVASDRRGKLSGFFSFHFIS